MDICKRDLIVVTPDRGTGVHVANPGKVDVALEELGLEPLVFVERSEAFPPNGVITIWFERFIPESRSAICLSFGDAHIPVLEAVHSPDTLILGVGRDCTDDGSTVAGHWWSFVVRQNLLFHTVAGGNDGRRK